MDFVAWSGIDISCSVLITGVSNTITDDEILDWLRVYGTLKTVLSVDDPISSFHKNLIAEFDNVSSFTDVKPILPYTYNSRSVPDRVYRITSLADEYTATAGHSKPTPNYLKNLKEMSDRAGTRFEDVLKTVMDQIQQHLTVSGATNEDGDDDDTENGEEEVDVKPTPLVSDSQTSQVTSPSSQPHPQTEARPRQSRQTTSTGSGSAQRRSLSQQDLNPPYVERHVVEHVVRNIDLSVPASLRLRSFSGRIPKPSNEADYESWRSQIDLLLADPSLSLLHVTRRIMESLLAPASDLVKGLGPDTLPPVLLRVLDSAFGTVEDGEELYAKFLNTLQNPGERPSTYLQRLQLALNTVVKRGGVLAADTDRHLLKQFVRGCWDNTVIAKLQLEQRKGNPPAFSELLLLLRTEEERQQAKETLMKKHINAGSPKHKATIQSQSTCSCGHTSSSSDELKELKKQMQQLQRQMSAFLSAQKSPAQSKSMPAPRQTSRTPPQSAVKPKAWYCFNCGEDGHISSSCSNAANPSLVEQKKKQLRQKQQAWTTKPNQSN